MIPLVLGLKTLVVAYAILAALRARLRPVAIPLIAIALLSVAVPALVASESLAGVSALARAWPWIAPLGSTIASGLGARRAFRAVDGEPDGSERVPAIEGAAYALLASAIFDAGLTAVGVIVAVMVGDPDLPSERVRAILGPR